MAPGCPSSRQAARKSSSASGGTAKAPKPATRASCHRCAAVPIEIAVLGCGHPHLPDVLGVLASEPDLRLAAAWDSDPSAVPAAIGGAAVTRARTAIGRADAVVICAPVDERPGLCVEAARAGRPILVEKPIALTAAEARAAGPRGRAQPDARRGRALPARAARPAAPRRRAGGAAARPPRQRVRHVGPLRRARRLVRRPASVDAGSRARGRGRVRRPGAAPGRRALDAPRGRPAGAGGRRPGPRRPRRRRWPGDRNLGHRPALPARELGLTPRRLRARRVAGPPARRRCARACSS